MNPNLEELRDRELHRYLSGNSMFCDEIDDWDDYELELDEDDEDEKDIV